MIRIVSCDKRGMRRQAAGGGQVRMPVLLLVLALLVAVPVHAQEAQTADTEPVEEKRRSREPSRLFLGMWTVHLTHRVITLENNWLVGITHRGFFGATFLNSFGRRAYTAGIQRTPFSVERGMLTTSLGFRLGLISGYDGRFLRMARNSPVMPLIQGFMNVDVKRTGVEISYTFVVVSVAMSYRF